MDYSQFDLTSFGPKDKKIIKDNPGKELMELASLGLSDKAYTRLTDMQVAYEKQNAKQAETPEFQMRDDVAVYEADTSPIIKPVTVTPTVVKSQPPTRLTSNNAGQSSVWLYNKTTSNRVYMSRSSAERLVKRNPDNFQIVG